MLLLSLLFYGGNQEQYRDQSKLIPAIDAAVQHADEVMEAAFARSPVQVTQEEFIKLFELVEVMTNVSENRLLQVFDILQT